ncbi:MAG: hypothetical protein H6833_10945 [Planctomycetes bacterium]|nr:hypothetical protein [Planctomycetota bacterium]
MNTIDLQSKARPREGFIEYYWFENPHVGLVRTRFHRIGLPLQPLDSGLDWVEQPEVTEICVEWIELDVDDPAALDGVTLSSVTHEGMEASIYLGAAHNWIDVDRLTLIESGSRFRVELQCRVEFEQEGVARNERLELTAFAQYRGKASSSE